MKTFIKSIQKLPLSIKIIFLLFIVHLFAYKIVLIDIKFFSNKLIEIGELLIDFEIALVTSLIFYIIVDSRLELEKEKIYNRSIHLITSLLFAYFSFTDFSMKLLSKCKEKKIFDPSEFDIKDLEGNGLFKIECSDNIYKVIPNKKNFKKLINQHKELNYIIVLLDYDTYILVDDFKQSILNVKYSIKKYNRLFDNADMLRLENQKQELINDILNMFNCYIKIASKNEYSQNKLKDISIVHINKKTKR